MGGFSLVTVSHSNDTYGHNIAHLLYFDDACTKETFAIQTENYFKIISHRLIGEHFLLIGIIMVLFEHINGSI